MKVQYYLIVRDEPADRYPTITGPYKSLQKAQEETKNWDMSPRRQFFILSVNDFGELENFIFASVPAFDTLVWE